MPRTRAAIVIVAALLQLSCASPGLPKDDAVADRDRPRILKPVDSLTARPMPEACSPVAAYAAKQQKAIDPLYAPVLYTEHFYGRDNDGKQPITLGGITYTPYKRFDEPDTGLSGTLMLDQASGHALILYKGMNRLSRDKGGLGGMFTDIHAIFQAKFGTANDQFAQADRAYAEALCDPQVQTLEVIGYSLGSQFANYLAVKYSAVGVVFGDMGIDRQVLARYAQHPGSATPEQVKQNLTTLSLGGDMIVRVFGVGDRIGSVVDLPGGLSGVFHDPEVYAYAANSVLKEREKEKAAPRTIAAEPTAGAQDTLVQRVQER